MNVTATRTLHCFKDFMPAKRRRGRRTVRRVRSKQRAQRGGFFPLLALIPAAIAAGKAAALGAVSGAAGYGIKKALEGKKKKTYTLEISDGRARLCEESETRTTTSTGFKERLDDVSVSFCTHA